MSSENIASFVDEYLETRSINETGSPYELFDRATSCRYAGFLSDAINIGQKLVRRFPNDADLHASLGSTYVDASRYKHAQLHFERAVQLSKGNIHYLRKLAINSSVQGNYAQTEAIFKELLEKDPYDPKTIRLFCARMKSLEPTFALDLIQNAQPRVKNNSDKAQLLWADYRVRDLQGDYQAAYQSLEKSNKIQIENLNYTLDHELSLKSHIEEIFASREILKYRSLPGGNIVSETLAPVFIVGMPRSGSTILEKVLQHYFDIPSISEVQITESAMHAIKIGTQISTAIENVRDIYFRGLKDLIPTQKPVFIDKSLFNFRYLGILLVCFPKSMAVITLRNRNDIVWSNFVQHFSGSQLGYSFDLKMIIAFYDLVEDYIKFWSRLFPDRIMFVHNKSLVENPLDIAVEFEQLTNFAYPFVTKSDYRGAASPSFTASSMQIYEKLRISDSPYKNYLNFIPESVMVAE